MKSETHHDKRLKEILRHINDIVDDEIIIRGKEIGLVKGNRLVAEPDIIGISKKGCIYVVEYKGCSEYETRATKQLSTAEKFIYDAFNIPVRKFYIHGNLETQEIP
jgi:hypothetical protein